MKTKKSFKTKLLFSTEKIEKLDLLLRHYITHACIFTSQLAPLSQKLTILDDSKIPKDTNRHTINCEIQTLSHVFLEK